MPECLLDVCDINHSGVEDYTPEYIQGISREESCAEVDKAKGINSNLKSIIILATVELTAQITVYSFCLVHFRTTYFM